MSALSLLTPNWPDLPTNIAAFTTLRSGGTSIGLFDDGNGCGGFNVADHVGDDRDHVRRNREVLMDLLPNSPQWLTQVHGTNVLNLDRTPTELTADACITTQPNVVCAVLTADCLPVLFCDAKHGIVGAAHAGWRGLASGVLENTVSAILAETKHDQGNPEHISVWLGPAIGPSYFEVGHEVRDRFVNDDEKASRAFTPHPSLDGKFYADIYQLARLALNKVGVHTIFGGEFCTFSEKEKFYSYRRDGVTGRMATVIWVSGDRWQTTEGKKK